MVNHVAEKQNRRGNKKQHKNTAGEDTIGVVSFLCSVMKQPNQSFGI